MFGGYGKDRLAPMCRLKSAVFPPFDVGHKYVAGGECFLCVDMCHCIRTAVQLVVTDAVLSLYMMLCLLVGDIITEGAILWRVDVVFMLIGMTISEPCFSRAIGSNDIAPLRVN